MVVIEFGVIAFINKRIKWNRNFNNEGFHGLPVINENIGFTVQHAIKTTRDLSALVHDVTRGRPRPDLMDVDDK